MTVPFTLRDGTVVQVRPRDYSFYETRPDGVWCSLCEQYLPTPRNPTHVNDIDYQSSRMTHSVIYHIDRRIWDE